MLILEIIDREKAPNREVKTVKVQDKMSTKNKVLSSWISALDYNIRTGIVTMRLIDGRVYKMIHSMDPDIYASWVRSPSKGTFFHQNIRDVYI
jgi:hypothetical protein